MKNKQHRTRTLQWRQARKQNQITMHTSQDTTYTERQKDSHGVRGHTPHVRGGFGLENDRQKLNTLAKGEIKDARRTQRGACLLILNSSALSLFSSSSIHSSISIWPASLRACKPRTCLNRGESDRPQTERDADTGNDTQREAENEKHEDVWFRMLYAYQGSMVFKSRNWCPPRRCRWK